MKTKKFAAAVVAAALVAAMLCGCAYNPEKVMTVGEREITSGEYLYVQYINAVNAINEHELDGIDGLLAAEIDGVDGKTYLRQETIQLLLETVYIENEFARLELELDAYTNLMAEYYLEYYWTNYYATVLQKNGVSYASFCNANIVGYYEDALFLAYYGEDGEYEVADEDIKAHLAKNYVTMNLISFPTTDATGAALAADVYGTQKGVAQLIVDACASGSTLKDAMLKYYPTVYTALGNPKTSPFDEDAYTALLTEDVFTNADGDYDDGLVEDAIASGNGVHFYVADTGQVFVYEKSPNYTTDEEYKSVKETALFNMMDETFSELITENAAKLEYTIDEKAAKYYAPEKIVL